ncbi:EAL domain-containing protein [Neobacillus thermocopriae]|uniref:bifunctional diguanylate cyclase/phosphodiesterase n=1 Tax=Neobacillus thermocopriae TaxID=1215031 RepID=UPI002E251E50|nr:EAL domain-containing protein [Neobacillus thermocopriae]MED3715702.1 EAL domain-containing protein [Neobacillus thermocopriae]
MGISMWSVHFTGLLALNPFHFYHLFTFPMVIVSLLLAISGVMVSYLLFFQQNDSHWHSIFSGIAFGSGMIGMHFTGVKAMMGNSIRYDFKLVILSILITFLLSILSMYVWNRCRQNGEPSIKRTLGMAVLIGLTITLMHYMAMSGGFYIQTTGTQPTLLVSRQVLLIVVTVVNFFLFAIVLLLSYFNQKKAEQNASDKERRYRSLFEQNQDGIFILDPLGTIMEANEAIEGISGYRKEELYGMDFFRMIHPDDLPMTVAYFQDSQKGIPHEFQVRVYDKQQREIFLRVKNVPIEMNGKMDGIYVIVRNITSQIKMEKQLKQMAYYDALTGIPNRRLLQERLKKAVQQAEQNKTNVALFYLDCDRFKWVNDTHGHETGDLLLKGFVQRVAKCIRESDTLARLGGDEFALIVNGFESKQEVIRIADAIIQSMRKPWNINGAEFIVTTSIGISIYSGGETNINHLLAQADKALYASKEKRGGTYHFYTKEIAEKMDRNIMLEDGLRQAVSLGHFHLVYQPQVDIQENQLAGFEVLLRYTHPTIGMVSPSEFIPICEKIGIIHEVTEWVLKEVLKQQKKWKDTGFGEIPIAINISPTTLENPSFLHIVQSLMKQFETNPTSIEFEITEDAFMHNMNHVKVILGKLNLMGIKISLDDFGAGYSSLKYLKELPIDKVKIDRSFIKGIPEKEREKAIIESILELTRRLKGEVICEGIETEEQLLFLKEQGCQFVQGYYYSKPLSKEEVEKKFITQGLISLRQAAGQ